MYRLRLLANYCCYSQRSMVLEHSVDFMVDWLVVGQRFTYHARLSTGTYLCVEGLLYHMLSRYESFVFDLYKILKIS